MGLEEGPKVTSVAEMYGQFAAEALELIPEWRERLASDPSSLAELEPEVHAAFARGADLVVAGLIAMVLGWGTRCRANQRKRVCSHTLRVRAHALPIEEYGRVA